MLEECVSNHRHQRMTMKAVPRSSLEVIETEFLLQLLMSLLADPSCLDRRSQAAQVHPSGQVGKIVFFSPDVRCSPMSQASSPGRCVTPIPYPLRRSVGSTHADSSKSGFQPTFRPAAPTHGFPLGTGQHVFSRYR